MHYEPANQDESFLLCCCQGRGQNEVKQAITRALIQIVGGSSCLILAEGIEIEEDFAWFAERNIDFAQGYFIARPGPEPVRELNFSKSM